MASGDQVMRILGDFANYIAGARKAEEATGKVAKSATKISDGFTGSLIKVELLKKALNTVLQSMDKINQKNVSASRTHDERIMAVGTAAGSLGINGSRAMEIIESRKGAGSKDANEDVNFLQSMVQVSKSRPVPLSEQETLGGLDLFHTVGSVGSGEGGSEIQEGLAKGYSLEQIKASMSAKRKKPMGGAISAIGRSNVEDASAIRSMDDKRSAGQDMRTLLRREQDAIAKMPEGTQKRGMEFVSEWMPDAIKGMIVGNAQDMETMRKENLETKKQMDATKELSQQIRGLGGVINKSQTIPNGNTGVP